MTKRTLALLLVLLSALALVYVNFSAPSPTVQPTSVADTNGPILTPQRQQHILYGDGRGGGHLHGAGKPCKSEFPKAWDAAAVITRVKQLAANDNAGWEQQNNGYWVAEQRVDNVQVRVVLDDRRATIITAYPINVPRNACPYPRQNKPANDN